MQVLVHSFAEGPSLRECLTGSCMRRQTGKHRFQMFQITHRVPIILCRKLELLAHGPKVGQQFNAFKHLRNALHQQVVPKCMLSHSV